MSPLIFAVGRLATENVQCSGKGEILDGEIGDGEFELCGPRHLTRKD
jgi:hypothetical protein